jgi:hypothetical protein
MANACNLCESTGFSVNDIATELEPNTYKAIHCKYCGFAGIGKTSDLDVKVALINGIISEEEVPVKWISLEEYTEKYQTLRKEYEDNIDIYWSISDREK